MPPRRSITPEQILEAAFTLVQERGIGQLSARNIAHALGCSTQPVYSCFPSMADLEKALLEKVWRFALDAYLVQKTDAQSFFAMGMGYVAFGREQPHLFHLLYLSEKSPIFLRDTLGGLAKPVIDVMKRDPFLSELPDQVLYRIHMQLWLFTHGITALLHSDPEAFTDAQVRELLHGMGLKVIGWELQDHQEMHSECPCGAERPELP